MRRPSPATKKHRRAIRISESCLRQKAETLRQRQQNIVRIGKSEAELTNNRTLHQDVLYC